MRWRRLCLSAVASVALSSTGFAAESSEAALAADATWLKLAGYEAEGRAGGAYRSAVKSGDFFLAADGPTDPVSELRATLAAMSLPLEGDPNEHARCRFPARYIWLRKKGALEGSQEFACPDFDAWIFGQATESISIIFATGYLGNPASYYGHTLLKFNSSAMRESSELLDVTVNYGAVIPPGVGPLTYMFKGATGGFAAGFSHIEYYFHDHNYGELELRNLWEYELNLEADEVRFVLAHAWELLGKEFVYYFFRKNCAYRMAEVLEIVDGVEIIPPQRPWTVPQSVVRRVASSAGPTGPLVKDVRWHPSRQSTFYQNFRRLDAQERRVLRRYVKRFDEPDAARDLEALAVDSQQRIVETMIDYYQYLMPKDEPSTSDMSKRYRSLVSRRFSLPSGKRPPLEVPAAGPESDRAPGYVSVGALHHETRGFGAVARLRPAYYDVLDASASHVPNSELSMAQLVVEFFDDEVRLREASLFRVESVNGAVSGLPGDAGRSWVLGLGLHEQSPGCEDCLVARFEGDIGRSLPFGEHSMFGLYIGGALQDNRNRYGHAFARWSAFWNLSLNDAVRLQARYEQRHHFDSPMEWEEEASVRLRLPVSRDWDVRFEVRKNIQTAVSLSLGYFW